MGAPTEIYGVFQLHRGQVQAARELPFASVFVFGDDLDDLSSTERGISLEEIGLVRSDYDEATSTWTFQAEMHDDDWANTDIEVLGRFLRALPTPDARGLVVTREGWKSVPEQLFFIKDGDFVQRRIVDRAEEDPRYIVLDAAATLVRGFGWAPAEALFERLTSRA